MSLFVFFFVILCLCILVDFGCIFICDLFVILYFAVVFFVVTVLFCCCCSLCKKICIFSVGISGFLVCFSFFGVNMPLCLSELIVHNIFISCVSVNSANL